MSHNSFGHLFRFTTWGESHGPSIGCVVDGTPPRIELNESDIQQWLNKRKPGQSKYTSPRKEDDKIRILSGIIEENGKNLTTGTPISLIIENKDQRSKDYSQIEEKFRPGHADFTYFSKYGIRDIRGGGRQSARETAMRVAAGAIARKILPKVEIKGALVQLGKHKINKDKWDNSFIDKNPFWSPRAAVHDGPRGAFHHQRRCCAATWYTCRPKRAPACCSSNERSDQHATRRKTHKSKQYFKKPLES